MLIAGGNGVDQQLAAIPAAVRRIGLGIDVAVARGGLPLPPDDEAADGQGCDRRLRLSTLGGGVDEELAAAPGAVRLEHLCLDGVAVAVAQPARLIIGTALVLPDHDEAAVLQPGDLQQELIVQAVGVHLERGADPRAVGRQKLRRDAIVAGIIGDVGDDEAAPRQRRDGRLELVVVFAVRRDQELIPVGRDVAALDLDLALVGGPDRDQRAVGQLGNVRVELRALNGVAVADELILLGVIGAEGGAVDLALGEVAVDLLLPGDREDGVSRRLRCDLRSGSCSPFMYDAGEVAPDLGHRGKERRRWRISWDWTCR